MLYYSSIQAISCISFESFFFLSPFPTTNTSSTVHALANKRMLSRTSTSLIRQHTRVHWSPLSSAVTPSSKPLVANLLPVPQAEPSTLPGVRGVSQMQQLQQMQESSSRTMLPDDYDVLIEHHRKYHPSSVQLLVNEEIDRYYHQRQMLAVAGAAVKAGVGERVQLGVWGGGMRD